MRAGIAFAVLLPLDATWSLGLEISTFNVDISLASYPIIQNTCVEVNMCPNGSGKRYVWSFQKILVEHDDPVILRKMHHHISSHAIQ